jgi:hypothetical protein
VRNLAELKFDRIDEYIFAPFNTFIYLDDDQIIFGGMAHLREDLLGELNKHPIKIDNAELDIEWCLEDCEDFKLSKGVFSPPGKENSFIMARVVNKPAGDNSIPITRDVAEIFPSGSLNYKDVKFYFQNCGVGTCSVRVELEKPEGLTIIDLEHISEEVNIYFKAYLEDICFELAKAYVQAVRKLGVPHHQFTYLPELEDVDKSTHFIPWTHRIYHINDDALFNMQNPGEHFRKLMTPSRKMDISDMSIYENRYVYAGWGHSVIFTSSEVGGYSQTDKPVYDYVRLVEIAQAQWQFLDILRDVVTFSISSFHRHQREMGMSQLQEAIDEIRDFRNGMDRILSDYRGVKITFDTEKRVLLRELHARWLTNSLLEALQNDMLTIEELLDQLYQRQKEQREESLNVIALLFTIVGVIEVFALVIDILQLEMLENPFAQLGVIGIGTLITALLISLYLNRAGRG